MKTNPQMDWQQVALNGGPPCFHVEGPQYCGRAQRWEGHGNEAFHDYVSLDDLLNAERERAAKIAEDFDDWVWCECSECKVDASSHAVRTESSLLKLAAAIRGSKD